MADLNDLGVVSASEAGANLVILHPATREETDIVYNVLGFDAEAVVQAGRAFDREEAKRNRSDEDEPMQVRRNRALAIAAVTGWSGQTVGGEVDEYTEDRKAVVLANPEFVDIVTQVCMFGSTRKNFFPKSKGV